MVEKSWGGVDFRRGERWGRGKFWRSGCQSDERGGVGRVTAWCWMVSSRELWKSFVCTRICRKVEEKGGK